MGGRYPPQRSPRPLSLLSPHTHTQTHTDTHRHTHTQNGRWPHTQPHAAHSPGPECRGRAASPHTTRTASGAVNPIDGDRQSGGGDNGFGVRRGRKLSWGRKGLTVPLCTCGKCRNDDHRGEASHGPSRCPHDRPLPRFPRFPPAVGCRVLNGRRRGRIKVGMQRRRKPRPARVVRWAPRCSVRHPRLAAPPEHPTGLGREGPRRLGLGEDTICKSCSAVLPGTLPRDSKLLALALDRSYRGI